MDINAPNNFLFSSKYRVWRHVTFWIVHGLFVHVLFLNVGVMRNLFANIIWLPAHMLYSYPLMYWVLPQYLLKGKYLKFTLIIFLWVVTGFLLNGLFRLYIFIPLQEYFHFKGFVKNPWQQGTFLVLTITAGMTSMIVLFKHWVRKHQDWLQAEKEKATAELQLLKAQVRPHFLFNTLKNIYSSSVIKSPKTSQLILKLSSLLSYVLYDCKAEQACCKLKRV